MGEGREAGEGQFIPWKRTGCSQRQEQPCGLLGRGKGPGQAWDGAFWESPAWKKAGLGDPLEIPPGGRAGHPQAATESLSPTPSQGQEMRTNPSLCPFGEGWGLFGSSEFRRFSRLAWEHPVPASSSESAGQPCGSALFRNCSASYLGQQFQPWELLTHYPPISALKSALIPSPTFPISFSS